MIHSLFQSDVGVLIRRPDRQSDYDSSFETFPSFSNAKKRQKIMKRDQKIIISSLALALGGYYLYYRRVLRFLNKIFENFGIFFSSFTNTVVTPNKGQFGFDEIGSHERIFAQFFQI